MKIKNINVQLARAFFFIKMCFSQSRTIRMSDYDFFSMSSNRKNVNKNFFKKNVRFQHFSQKMRALEKWCVTKVDHCILEAKKGCKKKIEYIVIGSRPP